MHQELNDSFHELEVTGAQGSVGTTLTEMCTTTLNNLTECD